MNKIINAPDTILQDEIKGYLSLCGSEYNTDEKVPGSIIKTNIKDKVAIIVGGGGGNEPWNLGFVGQGLADAALSGNVYMAPPAYNLLQLSRDVFHEKGILYIGTNHMGDVLSFGLVGELAKLEGINTRSIFVADDIASSSNKEERRGVAGVCLVVKMAGAAASQGEPLDKVEIVAQKVSENIRSLSVTTSPGYLPGNGEPMCEMDDGIIEYGMGFNGEPGIKTEKLGTASHIVETMMDMLLDDLQYKKGEKLVIWLNGFGFTSVLEQLILMKEITEYTERKEVTVYDKKMKELFRPQGTGGVSITVMKLENDMIPYYDMKAKSPLFEW